MTLKDVILEPVALYYFSTLLMIVPVMRIFKRAGFQPWWALLLGVPDIGLALCVLALALRKWPAGRDA